MAIRQQASWPNPCPPFQERGDARLANSVGTLIYASIAVTRR
jgi:hypothetical protein